MKTEAHRHWGLTTLLIAALSVTACAQFNHAQPNSPVAMSAVDVTARPGNAPEGASAARMERETRSRARA